MIDEPDMLLVAALERTALGYGWRPVETRLSDTRITMTYVKDPLIELIDSLPGEDD